MANELFKLVEGLLLSLQYPHFKLLYFDVWDVVGNISQFTSSLIVLVFGFPKVFYMFSPGSLWFEYLQLVSFVLNQHLLFLLFYEFLDCIYILLHCGIATVFSILCISFVSFPDWAPVMTYRLNIVSFHYINSVWSVKFWRWWILWW